MSESVNIRELNDLVSSKSDFINLVTRGMDQTIVGQKHLVESLLISLLANGHVLLEGVPGLAKTLAIKTLAQLIDAKYSRIQFTPDLLPADVLGTMIYSVKNETFQVKKGPIFANFVLADEINRAPAKVQSALLEAMQERQVTIGDSTFPLDKPFLVMATQNPIEQEGTYPLPEAQVDRFLMKVVIGYPTKDEEREIIRMNISPEHREIHPLVRPEEVTAAQKIVEKIYVDEKIERYIVDIVFATRSPREYGLEDLASYISFRSEERRVGKECSIRIPPPAWLCDSRRCNLGMPRCSPPPYWIVIRGRSQQLHHRYDNHRYPRQGASALMVRCSFSQ